MKKILIAALMLITTVASATEVENMEAFFAECKAATVEVREKLPLVGAYLEGTYLEVEGCRLERGDSDCLANARRLSMTDLKKALKASKSQNIRALLKAHQAAYLSVLNGFIPMPEELKTDYNRRQQALRSTFVKTLGAFDIELAGEKK